jgi:hypothetical protein
MTAAVPVFVRVSDWEVELPAVTFPKEMVVALAASDPEEAVVELVFAAGVPAPVRPVQPEIDRAARRTRQMLIDTSGVRRVRAGMP